MLFFQCRTLVCSFCSYISTLEFQERHTGVWWDRYTLHGVEPTHSLPIFFSFHNLLSLLCCNFVFFLNFNFSECVFLAEGLVWTVLLLLWLCISCRRPRLDCFTPVMVTQTRQRCLLLTQSNRFLVCFQSGEQRTVDNGERLGETREGHLKIWFSNVVELPGCIFKTQALNYSNLWSIFRVGYYADFGYM